MLQIYDLIISPKHTLHTALERMTANRKGLLFVCDTGTHLVGVVSDGDVRRALVDEISLIAAVEDIMNFDPIIATSLDEGLQLLENHSLLAVPVLDEEGQIEVIVMRGRETVRVIEKTPSAFLPVKEKQVLETCAIIPARGGSKRIPKKNIALVAGLPLIAYAIRAAKKAKHVSQILISTDDQEVAHVAEEHGARVPWLRSAHLAQDTSSSLDMLLHAAEWILESSSGAMKYGLLIEPTAPLRLPKHLDQAVEFLDASPEADSVVSVSEVPHVFNPEELLVIREGKLTPLNSERTMDNRLLRGQQQPVYVQNGLVYAFRLETLLAKKSLYGDKTLPLVTDWKYFLDIDTPADLDWASYQIQHHFQELLET